MLVTALALTVVLLIPIGGSVWLVARRGLGVRLVALTVALAVGLELVLQAWAARILSVGIVILAVLIVGAVYGGWWVNRDLLTRMLERAGREVHW